MAPVLLHNVLDDGQSQAGPPRLLGTALVLLIDSLYLSVLAAAACAYMGIAGVVITVVGIKRTDLREEISVHIKKGEQRYEKA